MPASTGFKNAVLGSGKSVRDIAKDMVLRVFSGVVPVDADAAETGTYVGTITTGGATAKVAQVVTITPVTAGTTGTWTVVLNGQTIIFTDDGTPTVAEVCTGLVRAIDVAQGKAGQSITTVTAGAVTAGATLNIPDIYRLFTVADNTTNITITAATAGVSFEYSSTATGAGNTLTSVLTTDSAYGLRWEIEGNVAGGILEKLSTDTWSGVASVDGTPITYGRWVEETGAYGTGDSGALSTTEKRIQALCGTSGSEIVLTHVDVVAGETITVTSASLNVNG